MKQISGHPRSLIGMVHVGALPGTPAAALSMAELTDHAVRDATALEQAGFDALMIENMHDRPYLKGTVGPEITAGMTVVARAVVEAVTVPCGIQILAAANREAMAVAHAAGLRFVRAEAFTFAHVADEGIIEASAGELLRYRRSIGANDVLVLADIQKKHAAHAITADVALAEFAKAVAFCGGDAAIVTGNHTGEAPGPVDFDRLRAASSLPILVGSGAAVDNAEQLQGADGIIVGSSIKLEGDWRRQVCPVRASDFVDRMNALPAPETLAVSI